MAIKFLNHIKKELLVLLICLLANLEKNSRLFFLYLVFLQFVISTSLFGLWNIFNLGWHLFSIITYIVLAVLLIKQTAKSLNYVKRSYVIKLI